MDEHSAKLIVIKAEPPYFQLQLCVKEKVLIHAIVVHSMYLQTLSEVVICSPGNKCSSGAASHTSEDKPLGSSNAVYSSMFEPFKP